MNTQEDDSLLFHGNSNRNKLLWYGGLALFVAWNILLFILAVVAIAKANNQSSGSGSTFTYAPTTRAFTVGPAQTMAGGKAVVSLLPSGNVRVGGGTSVYLDRGNKPNITANARGVVATTFNPPASGTFINLGDSELAFLAYTDAAGAVWGTLGVVSVRGFALSSWSKPVEIPGMTITEAVIPLNRFSGPKKSFVLAGGGKLVVGVIESEVTSDLRFTVSAVQNYKGSSNTLLARLSDKAFALAYFTITSVGNKQHLMQATVGNVSYDASGNFQSLKLAPVFNYTSSSNAYHAMFPLVHTSTTATEFVIAYPSTSAILINSTTAPDDTLVVLKGRWNEQADTLSFGPTTVLTGVKPTALMTATALPTTVDGADPKGVIVFVNEHENNALTAVAVTKDVATFTQPDKLSFASTLKIADGVADPSFQVNNGQVVPYISANYIDQTRLAVSFSDFANLGKVSTMVLTLNPHTLELSVDNNGAKFVTSGPNPNYSTDFWWVVAAPLKFSSQVGYALWQYLQTSGTPVIQQSVVEIAPPPFGIIPDKTNPANPGQPVQVVVSGVYKFTSGSPPFTGTVGRNWYTDTLGELHLRAGNDTSIGYVDGGNVLLSLNSRVGVSISNDELLLVTPGI